MEENAWIFNATRPEDANNDRRCGADTWWDTFWDNFCVYFYNLCVFKSEKTFNCSWKGNE